MTYISIAQKLETHALMDIIKEELASDIISRAHCCSCSLRAHASVAALSMSMIAITVKQCAGGGGGGDGGERK